MRHFKLFIGISLVLHFLIAGFLFISWNHKKNGEWKGGDKGEGLVTVELNQFTPHDLHLSTHGSLNKKTESRKARVVNRQSIEGSGQGNGSDSHGPNTPDILAKIRQKIFQAKQYPLVAKRQGIEGRVQILFALNPGGEIQELSVIESSGFPLLDQEALATVKRASPYPYYADDIIVSLKFELTE